MQSLFSVERSFFDTQNNVEAAFNGSKIPETNSLCSSGNCSWDPYQSLAVCHQCVDISDQIQIDDSCFYQKTAICVAYLMNGLMIELGLITDSASQTRINTSSSGALLRINNVGRSLVNFTKLHLDSTEVTIIEPACYYREQSYIAQCVQEIRKKLIATECALYWCINIHSAAQEFGVLRENLLGSWWSSSSGDVVLLEDRSHEEDPGTSLGPHIQLLPSDLEGGINVQGQNLRRDVLPIIPKRPSSQTPTNHGPCYIGYDTNEYFRQWLTKMFTSEVMFANESVSASRSSNTDEAATALYGDEKRPPVSGGMSDSPRLDPIFEVFSNV